MDSKVSMIKDFDGWIEKKKESHYKDALPPLFKERDIWWVSVGINVGYEEDGKNGNYVRPVLIIKKFSRDLFLGVPMSTKLKENKYYIKVTVKGDTVSALSSQIRVFSSKRMWNKLAELDEKDINLVLNEVGNFFAPLAVQEGRG